LLKIDGHDRIVNSIAICLILALALGGLPKYLLGAGYPDLELVHHGQSNAGTTNGLVN
jgi:hypothetical protein